MNIYKLIVALVVTLLAGFILTTRMEYLQSDWTSASMKQVSDNMGDQVAIREEMRKVETAQWLTFLGGLAAIGGFWAFLYRKGLRTFFMSALILLVLPGCGTTFYTVIVTPPNYAIVINNNNPGEQATGNNFGDGELMNVTQVKVAVSGCNGIIASGNNCSDKLVAQVEGAPQSRIYTKDPNTGTAGANQALCFEAQGINGCLDFSVTAKIMRDDAKCYANKMGVRPVDENGTPSRYNFIATPLSEALDNRVIQIAGSVFAKATAEISPLKLASEKFGLFDNVRSEISTTVHEATCITLLDLAINGGVVWDSKEVQATIDQAAILQSQIGLAGQQNDLAMLRAAGIITRTLMYSQVVGLNAALQLLQIDKWDGTYLLPSAPSTSNGPLILPVPAIGTPTTP